MEHDARGNPGSAAGAEGPQAAGGALAGNAAATPGAGEVARRLGPALVLGVLWAFAPAVCGIALLANIGGISDWLEGHRGLGLPLYILIFAFSAGFGLLPTYAQAILGGWVFGLAAGFPAALAGFAGGAAIGYVVARTVAKRRAERLIDENPKARAVRDALIGHGFWRTLLIVALIRVPPNSPFALTNLVMAGTGVSRRAYLIGTLLGMSPRTGLAVGLASAAAATGARDIQSFVKEGPGVYVLAGGLLALFVVVAVIGHIAQQALRKVTGTPSGPRAAGATP